MGTPEFPNLGKHCSVEDCRLIDFLPFSCDQCNEVFCLEHRSYDKHHCPNANQKDVTVLICPLCAKGVHLVVNEDPNITWESHVNKDCDPSNYQRATKKKKCPVIGCKEILTFSNTIRCRNCTIEHCLKHRFGPDHKCRGAQRASSGFQFMNLLKNNQKVDNRPVHSPTPSSNWTSSFLKVASNVRASAETSMAKLSIATTDALQKAKEAMTPRSSVSGQAEECLHCHARFSSVMDLIKHVEKFHENNERMAHDNINIDVCPKCSRGFRDAVSLVKHVERDHGGTSVS